jgi:hypothetical protein
LKERWGRGDCAENVEERGVGGNLQIEVEQAVNQDPGES